jgi:predicted amidohydrolase YtcJ
LKPITLDSADMDQEEQTKGSIEVGKLSNLAILNKNPLKVQPMTIEDINVMETRKEGNTIEKAA